MFQAEWTEKPLLSAYKAGGPPPFFFGWWGVPSPCHTSRVQLLPTVVLLLHWTVGNTWKGALRPSLIRRSLLRIHPSAAALAVASVAWIWDV
jgi:hypothetical protein